MNSVEDRQATLSARFPRWIPRTLDAMVDAAAGEFPDRPFVIADDRMGEVGVAFIVRRDGARVTAEELAAPAGSPGSRCPGISCSSPKRTSPRPRPVAPGNPCLSKKP